MPWMQALEPWTAVAAVLLAVIHALARRRVDLGPTAMCGLGGLWLVTPLDDTRMVAATIAALWISAWAAWSGARAGVGRPDLGYAALALTATVHLVHQLGSGWGVHPKAVVGGGSALLVLAAGVSALLAWERLGAKEGSGTSVRSMGNR